MTDIQQSIEKLTNSGNYKEWFASLCQVLAIHGTERSQEGLLGLAFSSEEWFCANAPAAGAQQVNLDVDAIAAHVPEQIAIPYVLTAYDDTLLTNAERDAETIRYKGDVLLRSEYAKCKALLLASIPQADQDHLRHTTLNIVTATITEIIAYAKKQHGTIMPAEVNMILLQASQPMNEPTSAGRAFDFNSYVVRVRKNVAILASIPGAEVNRLTQLQFLERAIQGRASGRTARYATIQRSEHYSSSCNEFR